MISQSSAAVGLLCVLSLSVEAQSVVVVDAAAGVGSDFDNVTDAVAAAVPGEIVFVRPGTYNEPTLLLDKPVFLVADAGPTTLVGELAVSGIAAGKQVLIHGFTLDVTSGVQPAALTISNCLGRVTVQDCTVLGAEVSGANPGDVVSVTSSASVTLTRVTLLTRMIGGPTDAARNALSVVGSTVAVHASSLEGGFGGEGAGDLGLAGGTGGAALSVSGATPSRVFVGSSTLTGGFGGAGGVGPVSPLSCSDGGTGGDAIAVDAALGAVTVLDSVLLGGIGGVSANASCADGLDGAPSVVTSGSLDEVGPSGRTIFVTPIAREGQVLCLMLKGLPGEFIVLSYSLVPGPAAYAESILGGVHIGPSFFNRMGGFVGPTGMRSWALTLQDTGVDGFVMHSQAFHLDLFGEKVSVSSPSATLMLDASF